MAQVTDGAVLFDRVAVAAYLGGVLDSPGELLGEVADNYAVALVSAAVLAEVECCTGKDQVYLLALLAGGLPQVQVVALDARDAVAMSRLRTELPEGVSAGDVHTVLLARAWSLPLASGPGGVGGWLPEGWPVYDVTVS